jgi:hypothetical protein
VIKAFVDKQRRLPEKMAEKPKSSGRVEIGAVWTLPDTDGGGDSDKLQAGRFFLDVAKKPLAVASTEYLVPSSEKMQ